MNHGELEGRRGGRQENLNQNLNEVNKTIYLRFDMYMHILGYQKKKKNWYHHGNTFLALLQKVG